MLIAVMRDRFDPIGRDRLVQPRQRSVAFPARGGGEIDARIELDLRLRRIAEGGVVLDASGAAFGMAVFGPRRRVLVIPAATIERVADKLASHGRIRRGCRSRDSAGCPVRRRNGRLALAGFAAGLAAALAWLHRRQQNAVHAA